MTEEVPAGFQVLSEHEGFAHHVGPIYWRIDGQKGILAFRVAAHHLNPAGICHGGMMMAVMDMALGFNNRLSSGRGAFPPTIQLSYDFLQPAQLGDWLESDVNFTHNTPRMGFANGFLVGPRGVVLRCSGICRLPRPDDPRFGDRVLPARAQTAAD